MRACSSTTTADASSRTSGRRTAPGSTTSGSPTPGSSRAAMCCAWVRRRSRSSFPWSRPRPRPTRSRRRSCRRCPRLPCRRRACGCWPGRKQGEEIQLGAELLIGRSYGEPGALGGDRRLSRRHARIARGPGGVFFIEDTGSSNGTTLNHAALRRAHSLKDGDEIEVGSSSPRSAQGLPRVSLAVELDDDTADRASPAAAPAAVGSPAAAPPAARSPARRGTDQRHRSPPPATTSPRHPSPPRSHSPRHPRPSLPATDRRRTCLRAPRRRGCRPVAAASSAYSPRYSRSRRLLPLRWSCSSLRSAPRRARPGSSARSRRPRRRCARSVRSRDRSGGAWSTTRRPLSPATADAAANELSLNESTSFDRHTAGEPRQADHRGADPRLPQQPGLAAGRDPETRGRSQVQSRRDDHRALLRPVLRAARPRLPPRGRRGARRQRADSAGSRTAVQARDPVGSVGRRHGRARYRLSGPAGSEPGIQSRPTV